MANTEFRICIAYAYAPYGPPEPPLDAWALVEAPPILRYPEPTGRNGRGYPRGFSGKPWVEFGRQRIPQAGVDFYNSLFATAAATNAYVQVRVYNPRLTGTFAQHWELYKGILWRPTYSENALGAPELLNYRVLVTELTASTWADTGAS